MISKFSVTLSIISCNVWSKGESVHIVWQYLVWCVIENLHFKWDATLTSHFMYFLVRNYEEFTRNIRHTKMWILSLRHYEPAVLKKPPCPWYAIWVLSSLSHSYLIIVKYMYAAWYVTYTFWWASKNGHELLNLRVLNIPLRIEYMPFNVWVRYFVWNFKGYIWNSTQNILPIHGCSQLVDLSLLALKCPYKLSW